MVVGAMKTGHGLTAPFDGVVETVSVAVGEQVYDAAAPAVVCNSECTT